MKVTTKEVKGFKPVELNIVLETQEELKAFKSMCVFDINVAHEVKKHNTINTQTLITMLRTIYESIK